MDTYDLNEPNGGDDISSDIIQDISDNTESSDVKEERSDLCQKSTFKNSLQAKKRLKAFAHQKQILISPKAKTEVTNEQSEFRTVSVKSKKEQPMDRARATIEEIELLKKSEFMVSSNNEERASRRSRSKSSEIDFVFRKHDKKMRNYRRSDNSRISPSPSVTTAKEKHSEKLKHNYPKNWEEFNRDRWTFEKLMTKDSRSRSKNSSSSNDICRQLLFEAPAEAIKPFHYKGKAGDDINVPFKFLRYTSAKPKVPFSVNIFKSNEPFLKRNQVLEKTRKNFREILQKFYGKSGRKFKTSEPMGQRNWYQKNWRDVNSKALETSIGLSFLQNYSDDEEDEDQQIIEQKELPRRFVDESEEENEEIMANVKKQSLLEDDNENFAMKEEKSTRAEEENNGREKQECIDTFQKQLLSKEDPEEIMSEEKSKEEISVIEEKSREESSEDKLTPDYTPDKNKGNEDMSWTPERKPSLTSNLLLDTHSLKKKKLIVEEDEDTNRQEEITEDKKKRKKKKYKHSDNSDSSTSSDRKRSSTKKKKKLARRKKRKEREKRMKRKEKEKEKKMQKAKEKKKEILKKLKKELEMNLENENVIKLQKKKEEESIKVKVEKEDPYKNVVQLETQMTKFLKGKDFKYQEEKKSSKKKEIIQEIMNIKVKKEVKGKDMMKIEDEIKDDKDKVKHSKKSKKEEIIPGEETPDTEEYQSNWESDEGMSSFAKPTSKKSSRGWESDEEMFERSFAKKEPTDLPFGQSSLLEMPLDIKFPKRRFGRAEKKRSRTRSPEFLDMEKEIKKLAAERMNLNKERMQLEMERIRIHELERKKSIEEMEERVRESFSPIWSKKEGGHERRHEKDERVHSTLKEKGATESRRREEAEKPAAVAAEKPAATDVVHVHSSPEITSTKSPTHAVLENAYQEFMKAVAGGDDTAEMVISSEDAEERHLAEETAKTKVMYSRSQRDRHTERAPEVVEERKPVATTDPKILQEILLPDEMPEVPPPVPAPVPLPKLDLKQSPVALIAKSNSHAERERECSPKVEETREETLQSLSPIKPFTFSTLVIPSKKTLLVERSNWKVDDDSEEEEKPPIRKTEDSNVEKDAAEKEKPFEDKIEESAKNDSINIGEKVEVKKENKKDENEVKRDEKPAKRKHSRSCSPVDSRDKRRKEEDSRKKENDRRRDSGHRKEETRKTVTEEEAKRRDRGVKKPSPSPRRREASPRRRRSPMHRRSPPRRRSSPRKTESRRPDKTERRRSPQRTSPSKRRRSYSPVRSGPARRKSNSPRPVSQQIRMSRSPRRSPMEGLKRSVADSTISDDLLPQPYAVDSTSSPLCSSTPAPTSRRSRLNLSPKRQSLDERINQVLGIESNQQPAEAWKQPEPSRDPRQNVSYSGYHHHEITMDSCLSSTIPQASKVLQVGNILQVVPTEDLYVLPPPQPVQPPPSQKILQVGNMLQIVPSEMEPMAAPVPPQLPPYEAPPTASATPFAERQSAEDVLVERMAENTRKRLEKEERRKEKEKKKKDKDKKKKMKLKVSTEEMIKRALELDGYIGTENEDLSAMVPEIISDSPGLDPSRSILSTRITRSFNNTLKTEKERKSVQFADGVRPGEGTSPSGGEELSSPPPQTDVMLKPKKYKKLSSKKKKKKRKVKVKVIRKPAPPLPSASDEEFENLPPPSPPPGSPPPHVFPPRAKVHTINNIPQHYLPSYGVTTAPQTPPVVQPRMTLPYQAAPTAMYRTPPPHVTGQHYQRMSHAPNLAMNVPPPPAAMHRDPQTYGTF